jgi:sodium/pantothenate symporter
VSGGDIVSGGGMSHMAGMIGYAQAYSNPLAFFLAMRVYGPRIKAACDHFDVLTVPQLLAKRYKTVWAKRIGAICIMIALGGMLVGQFKAMGETFSVLLGVNYVAAVMLGAIVVSVYSLIGGYTASVWTDVIQGVIMIIGSVSLYYYAQVAAFGRIMAPWELFPALYAHIATVNPAMLTLTGGVVGISTLIIYTLVNLGCGIAMPQQTIVLFSIKNVRAMKYCALWLLAIAILLLWTVNPSAMMAHKIFETPISNTDQVIPLLTLKIMPPVFAALFMSAILSAIMSTVDGVILVASSAISQDILRDTWGEKYEKNSVMYDRIVVGLFALLTMLFALKPPSIIFYMTIKLQQVRKNGIL